MDHVQLVSWKAIALFLTGSLSVVFIEPSYILVRSKMQSLLLPNLSMEMTKTLSWMPYGHCPFCRTGRINDKLPWLSVHRV